MAGYRFASTWEVGAPREQVWDALLEVRAWPSWWKGFRAVERLADGDECGIGMVVRQRWHSLLPYTMTIDLEIVRIAQQRLLEGRATGDMEGTCTWTFDEHDGRTRVRFVLEVSPTRWWMRLPVPFAGRVFAWNCAAIMSWGGEGLARLLGTAVAEGAAGVRLAAA